MKKFIILFILSVFLYADGINWINDINKAQKIAKAQNKIIMVFIEASHCPWCEKMKEETLSQKDVVRNINKYYVALKVDADSNEVQKTFGNISITPTLMFYSPDGEPLEIMEGYQNEEFLFWGMSRAEEKFKSLQKK